ncbi:hypothetical protein [Mesorhizobium sp.]|uniref:hypothetical protein n=1 Tax=Mesorhizobium sp. TaxID=1871066 RepID=UPI000FE60BF3|nr:hypothetical protein [Mesorhizobium sp.]RWF66829.1 MAG: hypothetical protein EOS47_04375 [Mesorhizobium sp.]
MSAVILWIAGRTGLGSFLSGLIAYAVVLALAGGGFLAWSAHKYNQGYAAGEAHERADWHDRMRLAAIAQAAEAKTRQADIDAAAHEYIDQQDVDALKISALEDELAKEKANATPPNKGQPACVATPRGVSTRLNSIGR